MSEFEKWWEEKKIIFTSNDYCNATDLAKYAYEAGRAQGKEELHASIVEIGQLKQKLWPMKDAEIARWKNAYINMRDFAVNSGLDIVCTGNQGDDK